MPQLDDMVLFAAVVREGGFTAAARRLDMPLSTVSRRIQLLEQSLDTRLLERTTRQQKLTEAGQIFFQHCQQLVAQAEEAERALQRLKQEPSGHIRIALPFSVDDSWATLMLSGFLAKYPKISIEAVLKPGTIDPDDADADVLFSYGRRPETHHPVTALGSARIGLFASPRYLQRAGAPQKPSDLEEHDFVGLTTLPWPDFAPEALHGLRLNHRLLTNDLLMARLVCVDGLGISWLPLLTCQRFVSQGTLVQLMPEHMFALQLWLVSRAASRTTPKVALLTEHLAGLLGAAGAWEALERGRW